MDRGCRQNGSPQIRKTEKKGKTVHRTEGLIVRRGEMEGGRRGRENLPEQEGDQGTI
jgi:hypothetical protein